MTLAMVDSFPPVARNENLDRLAALRPRPASTPNLWTEVHNAVQEQLVLLESEVLRKATGIRVAPGRTQGDRFFLFSYRTFFPADSAIDPVVVGMTFTLAPQGVNAEADASGEQTGDWVLPSRSKTVGNSREELLAAARELARTLRESAEVIATALKDPSRRVE
jgi:hypothetical protein